METVYTCSCGNQEWVILEDVRCTVCSVEYSSTHLSPPEFNRRVEEEIEAMAESIP